MWKTKRHITRGQYLTLCAGGGCRDAGVSLMLDAVDVDPNRRRGEAVQTVLITEVLRSHLECPPNGARG